MQAETGAHAPDRSHRLSILTRQEIDDLYGLPRFSDEDRLTYLGSDQDPEKIAIISLKVMKRRISML